MDDAYYDASGLRDDQLARASSQLAELASTLAMERRESRDLNERFQALVAEMQATLADRERLRRTLIPGAATVRLADYLRPEAP